MTAPKTPGELKDTSSIKYRRVIDADVGEAVQLEMADTGAVTADGIKIYRILNISAIAAEEKPNSETSGSLTMDGTSQPIPVATGARGVLIKADGGNTLDVLLFGVMPLEPGESVYLPTGDDASWIEVTGTNPDVLHYAVLTRT